MKTMDDFLRPTPVVDADHPEVKRRAVALRGRLADPIAVAKACFEWVRDEIRHARDIGFAGVPCSASETLEAGAGYCYAKSHLLAALLRANGIPAGFCYQRLSRDGTGAPFALHALNAVRLSGLGWYRIDARGDRACIRTFFTPPFEKLAYTVSLTGESNLPEVWPEPLPGIVTALRRATTSEDLYSNLPDIPVWTESAGYEHVAPPEPGRLPWDGNDPGE